MFGANTYGSSYYGQSYPALTVGVPVWVSPANHVNPIGPTPILVFTIPQTLLPIHFHLQLDTSNTFGSGSLREYRSWQLQTGWEYFNGSSWVAIPLAGIEPSYAGNQARYLVQSSLTLGTWYRRIRGRVKV